MSIAYPHYPHVLAERHTAVGTVAVIGYQGKASCRIWCAQNWFDAPLQPHMVLVADGQMLSQQDKANAEEWLTGRIELMVDMEQQLRAETGVACDRAEAPA